MGFKNGLYARAAGKIIDTADSTVGNPKVQKAVSKVVPHVVDAAVTLGTGIPAAGKVAKYVAGIPCEKYSEDVTLIAATVPVGIAIAAVMPLLAVDAVDELVNAEVELIAKFVEKNEETIEAVAKAALALFIRSKAQFA